MQETLYLESIEERESGATPSIIQTVRATSVFWSNISMTKGFNVKDSLITNIIFNTNVVEKY